jgi:co-chaperonin GroES (HSP10)
LSSKINPIKLKSLEPIKNQVVVEEMKFNDRYTPGGIFIPSDDGKVEGVRPRWGKVYAVGPEQTEVGVGQWVLVAHGRWTRGINIEDGAGIHTVRMIDNNDIWLVSDEEMVDETFGRPL